MGVNEMGINLSSVLRFVACCLNDESGSRPFESSIFLRQSWHFHSLVI